MTVVRTAIGAALGFTFACSVNATMKVPMSRRPWSHVGYVIFGIWLAHAEGRLEKNLIADINLIRKERGLPPLLYTGGWIGYQKPEGGWMDPSLTPPFLMPGRRDDDEDQ